ncbi:MAG: DUF835 domain-containing protein [Candidatus Thermoplasmatota archaeon]|nr:DUF835 domain-containing protein [Candidatus Thermoplasmatota archaeon]
MSKVQKVLLVNFQKWEARSITDTLSEDSRDILSVEKDESTKKILAYEPDLILLSLPEISIGPLMDAMGELEKEVFMVACSDDREELKKALLKGCDDYLLKPFEPFEINHRATMYLKNVEKEKKKIELGPVPIEKQGHVVDPIRVMGSLDKGHIYLIKEPKPYRGFEVFKEQVEMGTPCLAFTRKNPAEIRKGLKTGKPKIVWLSVNRSSREFCIDAKDMTKITKEIYLFLRSVKNGMIFLEGLEYLISQTDYQTVLRLLQYLNDKIMVSDDCILISLDPRTFTFQEISLIERECILW